MTPRRALYLTGGLLALLMLLGLARQTGRPVPRQAHHLTYFAVCAATGGTAVYLQRQGKRGWALWPALALLLSMPRTQPGRPGHWQRALGCAALYLAGAAVAK